jgi:hypothetical protein
VNKPRIVRSQLAEEIGPYHQIKGTFEAEIYPDIGRPLDTRVTLEVPDYFITWSDKEKLMQELNQVLKKYLL